jgi:hypothetical protein
MGLFRKHTRSRLGESRRKAKLLYQQILEEMDRERQQLKEHCQADAIPEDEEATLHQTIKMCVATFGAFYLRTLTATQPPIFEEDSVRKKKDVRGLRMKSAAALQATADVG